MFLFCCFKQIWFYSLSPLLLLGHKFCASGFFFLHHFSEFASLMGNKTFHILPNRGGNSAHMILSIHRLHWTHPCFSPSLHLPLCMFEERENLVFHISKDALLQNGFLPLSLSLSPLPLLLFSIHTGLLFIFLQQRVNSGLADRHMWRLLCLLLCFH